MTSRRARGRGVRNMARAAALAVFLCAAAGAADARLTRIDITRIESPAFGGASFGTAGTYDRLVGRAYGEVDAVDPHNGVIEDIHRAPRNARGKVEYATDVYILKPHDLALGNGTVLYDAPNRGNKAALRLFDLDPASGNEPDSGGDGFLLDRGYTLVWSAWQGDVLPGQGRMTIAVPAARRHRDSEITGRVRAEFIVDAPVATLNLSSGAYTGLTHASYAAVSIDNTSGANLTRRVRESDPRAAVPAASWAFADCRTVPFPGTPDPTRICVKDGFGPDFIYELTYTARNPRVLGLGFAATRDLISFLRYQARDDQGTPNPLGGAVRWVLMHGTAQAGRFLRGFLQLGFNQSEDGRIVADGVNLHLATQAIALNVRFGQPGRAYGQHEDHLYPAAEAPFAWASSYDPISMREGGLLDGCRATSTCPKIVQTVSSSEYWQGRMSLDTTDVHGVIDQTLPPMVRIYQFAGTQHFPAAVPQIDVCQQATNPNAYAPTMRALLVALQDWVVHGIEPPASRYPTLRDGTLVRADPASFGWPAIPGVRFTGLKNDLAMIDFGSHFRPFDESGQVTEPPVARHGHDYLVLVPKIDADGNEIAGVRSVMMQAPLGTYTGWNLRRAGYAEDELCAQNGSFIPFHVSQAERAAAGDPRRSLQERYGSHGGYVSAVKAAAEQLVADHFLLADDAGALVAQATASAMLGRPPVPASAHPATHGRR